MEEAGSELEDLRLHGSSLRCLPPKRQLLVLVLERRLRAMNWWWVVNGG